MIAFEAPPWWASKMPRLIATTLFLALTVITMTSGAARAQDRTPCAVCGTWFLVDIVERDAAGAVLAVDPARYQQPAGVLIYDQAGNVAVQIMNRSPVGAAISGAEARKTGGMVSTSDYVAYFGTYAISADGRTMTHHARGNLTSQDVGKSFARRFVLRGDELSLSFDTLVGQLAVTRTLRWRRVN